MPGFVRSKKDEARWKRAKKATSKSRSKDESSFSDRDWALTTHIYNKMKKNNKTNTNSVDKIIKELNLTKNLMKQSRKDPVSWEDLVDPMLTDQNDEDQGAASEEGDYEPETSFEESMGLEPEAEKAYLDKDPQSADEDETEARSDEPVYVDPDEYEKQERQKVLNSLMSQTEKGSYPEPSAEELDALRNHTRAYERYFKNYNAVKADPSENPLVAREGRTLEAFNDAVRDKKNEFEKLTNSDEYKKADLAQQFKMKRQFERDWAANNPDHHSKAIELHGKAEDKAQSGIDAFNRKKDEIISHILRGGAAGEGLESTEAGLQHAGITREDEKPAGGIIGDPMAAFALGNKDFIRHYNDVYKKKAKKISQLEDLADYSNSEDSQDIKRILGAPPEKGPLLDSFFVRYMPLLYVGAKKALNTLGLNKDNPNVDLGMIHEVGTHALVHAINTYKPEKGAKFTSWALTNIIKGMMGALKAKDPNRHVRVEYNKFQKKNRQGLPTTAPAREAVSVPKPETPTESVAPSVSPQVSAPQEQPSMPKPKVSEMLSTSGHSKARDMADKLKAVDAQKKIIIRRRSGE